MFEDRPVLSTTEFFCGVYA